MHSLSGLLTLPVLERVPWLSGSFYFFKADKVSVRGDCNLGKSLIQLSSDEFSVYYDEIISAISIIM